MASAADYIDNDEEETGEGDRQKLAEFHLEAMQALDDAISAQQEIRMLALQARRFVSIPGAQWEGPWGDQFENSLKVEINKTARGWRKIVLDYLANRIVPTFRNVGNQADKHTAATIGGLHRADSYNFKAQQARDNAFLEASAGGFGAYRQTTTLEDPHDKDNDDQRINPGLAIVDADQRVFFDPNSILYDKSDAWWGCVLLALTPTAFKREYPDAQPADMPMPFKSYYDWFAPHQIVIAEYYAREEVTETLYVFTQTISKDEQRIWASDLEDGEMADLKAQGYKVSKQRRIRCRIHKYVMSGQEVLKDEGYIAGSRIPIVPVYGNRVYVDGQERFTGHVQLAMDPARVYNAQISKLVETASLSPAEKPIFDPEQMPPNLQDLWAEAHVNRYPYLLAKALRDENGGIVQAGPTSYLKPPEVPQVLAALIQIMGSDIAELTNADDGADEVRANTSAEAMDIAATRVDAKSGVYLDAMKQSVQCEGEIYLSMAPDIYFRAGREVDVINADETDGTETLMEPFTSSGGVFQIRNDLTKGRYKVIADITEATSTLRDRTVRRMLELAKVAVEANDMELAQACIATAVENMDGEGIDNFQEWNRRRMLQTGLAKPTPEEAQQMAQAEQEKQSQPDPAATALMAQAQSLLADAKFKGAKAQEAIASQILKLAQAAAVGGPEKAPEAPSGLQDAPTPLDQAQQAADIAKTHAETRQIHHEIDNPAPTGGK